jgi:hypothetical protein
VLRRYLNMLPETTLRANPELLLQMAMHTGQRRDWHTYEDARTNFAARKTHQASAAH